MLIATDPAPLQQALLDAEAQRLQPLLQSVYGLRMACVGAPEGLTHLRDSSIPQQVYVGQRAEDCRRAEGLVLQAEDSAIPLISEAFDAVYLYHALERASDPHQLLREAERILRPSGFLILVLHNPVSLFGLAGLLGRGTPGLLRVPRLKDWLKLLGLRLLSIDYGFYRYPWRSQRLLRAFAWLEPLGVLSRIPLGGVTVLMARKDVFGMTVLPERLSRRLENTAMLPAGAAKTRLRLSGSSGS